MPNKKSVSPEKMIGETFGSLAIIGIASPYVRKNGHKETVFMCRCKICGKEKPVRRCSLVSGLTKSCGCLHRQELVSRNTKHGLLIRGTENRKLLNVFSQMHSRCENPKAKNYKYYGGNGITVCDEWNTFEQFYGWAVESGYKPGLWIDRIDCSKGYSPSNCRWATPAQQQNNRSDNIIFEYKSQVLPIKEFAAHIGLPETTVRSRYHQGWDAERIAKTPRRTAK